MSDNDGKRVDSDMFSNIIYAPEMASKHQEKGLILLIFIDHGQSHHRRPLLPHPYLVRLQESLPPYLPIRDLQ